MGKFITLIMLFGFVFTAPSFASEDEGLAEVWLENPYDSSSMNVTYKTCQQNDFDFTCEDEQTVNVPANEKVILQFLVPEIPPSDVYTLFDFYITKVETSDGKASSIFPITGNRRCVSELAHTEQSGSEVYETDTLHFSREDSRVFCTITLGGVSGNV